LSEPDEWLRIVQSLHRAVVEFAHRVDITDDTLEVPLMKDDGRCTHIRDRGEDDDARMKRCGKLARIRRSEPTEERPEMIRIVRRVTAVVRWQSSIISQQ